MHVKLYDLLRPSEVREASKDRTEIRNIFVSEMTVIELGALWKHLQLDHKHAHDSILHELQFSLIEDTPGWNAVCSLIELSRRFNASHLG